ncbi:glycogen/starch/alpha-glucan phosphorylase [Shouchella shacheensis]|uniref:glycogen/starch/alpha-glucan phosphorylase n=1 Tax=Shouchella shacheensis TaxID=1649580 RepID=UPI0009E81545|nr:glycogen/starch/alpha-glucan phosphorylase [Shouchella shacheensis]
MTRLRKQEFLERLKMSIPSLGERSLGEATEQELYYGIAQIVNEEIKQDWQQTEASYAKKKPKQVYYLSMEFLIGRMLEANLLNCGLLEVTKEALEEMDHCLDQILVIENDAALGNGGLGRLAACFLDSLASLGYAGHGLGIRYCYGLFKQRVIQGHQVELPDDWLSMPYAWEVQKPEEQVLVRFGGEVSMHARTDGSLEIELRNTEDVLAVPYDVPIVGYENNVVNSLRLWSAESAGGEEECSRTFYRDLENEQSIKQISGYLYPDDSEEEGKQLRLKQQYFLVSASVQEIIRTFRRLHQKPLSKMPEKVAIQINDTHPTLTIPELMRILMDEEGYGWEEAWSVTTKLVAYTNHTTLAEALETWPVALVKKLLPRIYQIIHEVNERFCQWLWFNHPSKRDQIPQMAVIADGQVHMARLAIVGSLSVNGVARIHTDILKKEEMNDFYRLFPERFNNKTNGITHRRWLLQINPALASLISDVIGAAWVKRPSQLISLLRYSKDQPFLEEVSSVKQANKQKLANDVYNQTGVMIDSQSIFDVQIKRLHEYKRQLLNIFHVMHLFNELKDNPRLELTPRTFLFAAKAAPSYYIAKEIIHLINKVASVVNHDPDTKEKLKVVFLENYNISLAEKLIPAADISEQISTASKEASGTGNMKMMMNGAITLGTLDGANIEILDLVGHANMFTFGLTSEEVLDYYRNGGYSAKDLYQTDDRLRRILDQLNDGVFGLERLSFKDLYYQVLYQNDPYFVLKDFDAYIETHELIEQRYKDKWNWLTMSVNNTAYSGRFSSDRTIKEYAAEIWGIKPL